ncbi:YigZ family protein [Reinekea marina]|uniref:YigZ family protein n=2 Tax=Reinekea marina TaxID=1310421 RepID=A0ABV7WN25_9GAMM
MPSTLAEPVYCELEIKKSRFLTWLEPVASSEDAKARLTSIRKQYPDARHVCFAFYVNGSSGLSDDGEPSGTAAKPMFNVIAHNDLINVMAIVVRYFGGIKLGAGGLARAYGGAVAQAMTLANVVKVERKFTLKLTFDFALESQVRRVLAPFSIELENLQYTSTVSAVVTVSESTSAEVLSQLQSIAPGSSALVIDCDDPEAGL